MTSRPQASLFKTRHAARVHFVGIGGIGMSGILEYAPERLALYAVAGTKLVITGMSKEAAVTAVTDAFREVVRTQTTIERSEQDET